MFLVVSYRLWHDLKIEPFVCFVSSFFMIYLLIMMTCKSDFPSTTPLFSTFFCQQMGSEDEIIFATFHKVFADSFRFIKLYLNANFEVSGS